VLAERAGLPGAPVHLEQLRTYGYPDRDPTRRAVSVAYLGLAPDLPAPDQPQMSWQPVSTLTDLAFDHARILQDGVERARSKLEYTSLAAAFCQDEFTVGELRRVYEIVWGTALDPRNFHRKVTGARDFLVQTGTVTTSGGRPAQLYRRGSAVLLYPPMLRSRDHGIGQAGQGTYSGRRPDVQALVERVTVRSAAISPGRDRSRSRPHQQVSGQHRW
jgi:8-oxo-dGTP diphosphatase